MHVYAPQIGKLMEEKEISYEDTSREWATHHLSELIIGMGDLNEHVGRNIDEFQGLMEDLTLANEIKRERCC